MPPHCTHHLGAHRTIKPCIIYMPTYKEVSLPYMRLSFMKHASYFMVPCAWGHSGLTRHCLLRRTEDRAKTVSFETPNTVFTYQPTWVFVRPP